MFAIKDPSSFISEPYQRRGPSSVLVQLKEINQQISHSKTVKEAIRIFNELPNPNEYSYNALLRVCLKKKDFRSLHSFFNQMRSSKTPPSLIAYTMFISCCCHQKQIAGAETALTEMVTNGIYPDKVTYITLMRGYAEANLIEKGFERLKTVPRHLETIEFYLPLIRILFVNKDYKRIIASAVEIHQRKIPFDLTYYHYLLQACFNNNQIDEAATFFREMIEKGIQPTARTYNIQIQGYAASKRFLPATLTFKMMETRHLERERETYCVLISNLITSYRLDEVAYYQDLAFKEYPFFTTEFYNDILKAYFEADEWEFAENFYQIMLDKQVIFNRATYEILIKGYLTIGKFEKAYEFFCQMKEKQLFPDFLHYKLMAIGAIMSGNLHMVERLMAQMVKAGITINTEFYNALIRTFIDLDMKEKAVQFSHEMVGQSIPTDKRTIELWIRLNEAQMNRREAIDLYREHFPIQCEMNHALPLLRCHGLSIDLAWMQLLCFLEDHKENKPFWIAPISEDMHASLSFRFRWSSVNRQWRISEEDDRLLVTPRAP